VKGLVDLLDVAPTIADVFGVRDKGGADREFQGQSLLPLVSGANGKPLVLSRTIWDRPRYALRDARWAYLYDTATGAEQLFDTLADPGETKDQASREDLRVAYYRQTLHEWTRGVARSVKSTAESVGMSPEQCENLKALGYVQACAGR
jgi:arylsulfatase A-like enzyme